MLSGVAMNLLSLYACRHSGVKRFREDTNAANVKTLFNQ